MDEKNWWTSKGIWGNIVGAVGFLLALITGHPITGVDQELLSTQMWNIASSVSLILGAIGNIVGFYGRWKATTVISDKVIPTLKS
jgi:hypothetical protein